MNLRNIIKTGNSNKCRQVFGLTKYIFSLVNTLGANNLLYSEQFQSTSEVAGTSSTSVFKIHRFG